MADNSTQQGNDTIATDDLTTLNGGAVSGFKVQRVKVGYGADADLTDVSLTNGLPVALVERTTYVANTGPITGATATGTKTLAYLWHPSGVTKKYELFGVNVSVIAGVGGTQRIELRKITAENVTPGGTTGTIFGTNGANAASGGTVRIAPTGAPTITAGVLGGGDFPTNLNGNASFPPHLTAVWLEEAEPYSLRASTAEGYVIVQEVVSTITTAPTFNISFMWAEI